MVWPNVVALPWPALVAFEKAVASTQRSLAHQWVVLQIYA